ncbi:hypothetical protein ACTG9Q_13955 [Actinokineospora sp. 24-640]
MTAPDIDQDEILDEPPADAAVDEGGAPTQEDIDAITAALKASSEAQPTIHLLPMEEEIAWERREGDRHFLSIGDYDVVVDTAAKTVEGVDPEQIRLLMVAKLDEIHGAGAFDVGGESRSIDWTTAQILDEANGTATGTATTLAGAWGAAVEVRLTIDYQWGVTVAPVDAGADEPAVPAVIDGAYLGEYYGDSEFPFDDKFFVIDWSTWAIDQTTDEGLVGGRPRATSGGASYELYVWFGPDIGVQIAEATLSAGQAASEGDDDAEGHGITSAYLSDYYGADPLEFEGAGIVVDWDTWDPDQVTEEGLVGSSAKGADHAGAEYDIYIWFDPAEGAQIVSAERLGAPAEEAGETDPREHFDNVLVAELREAWTRDGRMLRDTSGKEYDVAAWLDGDSDSEPVFESYDGESFFATMKANTVGDEPKQVRCGLRIRDAEQVLVESEASV